LQKPGPAAGNRTEKKRIILRPDFEIYKNSRLFFIPLA